MLSGLDAVTAMDEDFAFCLEARADKYEAVSFQEDPRGYVDEFTVCSGPHGMAARWQL